ncbi:MAG TPA: carboxypeptidase regulatory-like domain-containing protein [Candidatus Sulfotelmatobacter sp.]|nr:carboxypeptidase regulatory-like domain-containing protein [Candidatus Sulfotelmatobacter sp.]
MDWKRFVAAVFAILVWSLLCPGKLAAQTTTTGDIAGIVTDPTNAVVPDAKVSLKDLSRGATQETTTNKEGGFHFYLLLPGEYSITVSAAGFQNLTRPVAVDVGRVSAANVQLALGSSSLTVTVTEQAPLIQVDTGNLSSTISEKQAANIPNPGNDITYIAQIAPGSVMNTAGGGLGNFSSYGISALANLFTLNGMDTNDPFLNVNDSGATNLLLGQNEVEEVSVVTNGYSGQYGGLAGANINYVTRGGTNAFHGRAIWYWNGRALNANSWFNNSTSPITPRSFVNANQYGGDVGGPIKKDKLFFYFNAEGLYLVIPTSVEAVIPSSNYATAVQNNINANFGGASSTISQFYQNMFTLYSKAPGANRAANTLPNGDCDSSFLGHLDGAAGPFGLANPCGLAFFSNVSNLTHEHLEAGRVDWNVTNRDRFFTRIQKDTGVQATVTDPINSLFNTQSTQPEWQGQAQELHTFSGGAVNQLIVAGQWYSAVFGNANEGATLAAFPTTLSWPGGQYSNLGGLDNLFPEGRRVTQFQASDDFTKPLGTHTLKVGVKYRRNWITNTDYSINQIGIMQPLTQDAFFWGGADPHFLTTPPTDKTDFTTLSQSFPTALTQPFAVYTIGGYVEDDWKVKPNFTLTLAFRLDHASDPICFSLCFSRPAVEFPELNTNPTTPYNQLMLINQKQMLPSLTAVEPQPRLGFAWQPHFWGMHNTVVRGGVGIFYDSFPGVLLDGFSENPPFDPLFTVSPMAPGGLSSPSDPNSLFASTAASNAAFQAGFKSGGSFSTISASVPSFSPPSLASSENKPKIPQYQKWSLEIERQFGQNTSLSVQYVGNHGIHEYFQNSGINGCNNTVNPTAVPPFAGFTSLPPCLSAAGSGINPSFLEANFAQSIGVSNYNGLTASFTHRYKSGLVQVNYMWSHALDMASNSGISQFASTGFGATNTSIIYPEEPLNPRFNYASADYDVRHTLNANYIWELPIKHYITRGHGPDRLLNGWNVNGAVFLRSGFPFTITDGGTTGALEAGGYGDPTFFPVQVFGSEIAPGGAGVNCTTVPAFQGTTLPSRGICLNPADFSLSASGFGNLGRNTFRGPYYWDTDFSLMKHTKVTERTELVFGAQFYNVFNHPNFDSPVSNVASSRFGQIIRTVSAPTTMYGSVLGADASPRLIQMKLEFAF